MFGGLAFLIGGNMAIAASGQGGVLVRVDPAQSDKLVDTTNAEMAVMRNRPMQGWLRVAPEHLRTKRQLGKWVNLGTEYRAVASGKALDRLSGSRASPHIDWADSKLPPVWISRESDIDRGWSLGGVDVDPATGQRGTELVEPGQAGFRLGLIGCGDGKDQGLNDDERGGVAGKEARSSSAALERHVHGVGQSPRQRVGDEDDGNVEGLGVLEQHMDVRLEAAIGEHDDGIVGFEREELVRERCSGVHEGAAGLPDPLRDELSVVGQGRRGPNAAPDDPVAAGQDADRILERLGRDVACQGLERGDVIANGRGQELVPGA